jgi:hypothetical protein
VPDESDPADSDIPDAPPGWISEDELVERTQMEIASQRIANRLIEVLGTVSNRQDPHALEFALLATILAVQDQVNNPTKGLLSYLLGSYQPLLAWMQDDGGFEIEGIGFRRRLDENGQFQLLMRRTDWVNETDA